MPTGKREQGNATRTVLLPPVFIPVERVFRRIEHAERYLVRRAARMLLDMRRARYFIFPLAHACPSDRPALPVVRTPEVGYDLSRGHHLDGSARKRVEKCFAVALRQ